MPIITGPSPVPFQFLDGGTQTAAFNAVAGTMYSINFAASLGTVTVQLPTAPAQGTCIAFARIDSNYYTSFAAITAGGSDTMDGGGPFALSTGNAIFIYQGTRWNVLAIGGGSYGGKTGANASTAFPPNIMARDGSGNSEINAPTSALHITNKAYVDGAIRSVSANTTANNRDTILANASGGAITITLPVTAGSRVTVKKTDNTANNVTVVGTSGTVDGDANANLVGMDSSAVFIGDGTNLQIEAINGATSAAAAWTSYTPVLSRADTGAVDPSSAASGKYSITGKTIIVQGTITSTNATAGSAAVSLPFTAKDRVLNCGTMAVTGATVPADQSGIAYMTTDQARLVVVAYSNGFRDVAAGAVLRWNVTYELP